MVNSSSVHKSPGEVRHHAAPAATAGDSSRIIIIFSDGELFSYLKSKSDVSDNLMKRSSWTFFMGWRWRWWSSVSCGELNVVSSSMIGVGDGS